MFLQRHGHLWQRAEHHKLICDALMRVFRGECRRLIINIPPRYSKTELAVINFISWYLGRVPDAEFIHASYSAMLAVNNSASVLNLVGSPGYAEVFPEVGLASSAAHRWKTTTGGVMYAAGAGGSITGFGAGKMREGASGAIVIDDPHKADEAASDTIRNGVIEWFQNTLESRKNGPDTPIILIMQRLHERDLAGWLLGDEPGKPGGNGEVWEHLCLPAILDEGTERERALWPGKHSLDTLRAMQAASPYVFAGQYQQRPAPPSGGEIKPDLMPTVDAVPAGVVEWCRGWDLGATSSGDYTAGCKIGRLTDGRYIIADVRRERLETHQRDALLKNVADADGRGRVKQSIPQDPGQAGKSQVMAFANLLAGHHVHFSPESGDKLVRARPLASQINVGNVMLLRGEWNEPFRAECRMFPNGAFDDQVDAASRAFAGLLAPAAGIFV